MPERATEFAEDAVFCQWELVPSESAWTVVAGDAEGQTQAAEVHIEDGMPTADWSHPIDVHFATPTIKGWPQLKMVIWRQDAHGRNEPCGYGSIRLPMRPGSHVREVACWRPKGTLMEEIAAFFRGGLVSFDDPAAAMDSSTDRSTLETMTTGTIMVELNIVVRGMGETGAEFRPRSKFAESVDGAARDDAIHAALVEVDRAIAITRESGSGEKS